MRFLDFLWPNLPGTGIEYIIPGQGEYGKWHPGWALEIAKPLFAVYGKRFGWDKEQSRIGGTISSIMRKCIPLLHTKKFLLLKETAPNPIQPSLLFDTEMVGFVQDLLQTKARLEHDIKIKSNSLFIDREKCLSMRKSFPVVSLATKL